MKHKFTKSELLKLLDNNFNKPVPEIAKLVGLSRNGFYYHLKKHNLTKKNVRFNEHAFKTIKNEQTSYWLGFLMADGYINVKGNTKWFHLKLAGKDEIHFKKFHTFLDSKIKARKYKLKDGREIIESRHYSNILCNDLIKHGCIPRKSLKLKFPNIPNFLLNHFIRGYFDGDGCINICRKNQNTPQMRIFTIGTKNFLDSLQSFFITIFNYKSKKYQRTGKAYILEIGGSKQCEQILQWLYSDASIYLNRKYNVWKKYRSAYPVKKKKPNRLLS